LWDKKLKPNVVVVTLQIKFSGYVGILFVDFWRSARHWMRKAKFCRDQVGVEATNFLLILLVLLSILRVGGF